MPDTLPNNQKIVPIRVAAEILGVSIDTIRRWDKEGFLHSERPNGKDRYFSVEEREKVKLPKPLSISEVASRLHISQSTLRRLETRGFIHPERDSSGERVYTQKSLENFLASQYFLRKNDVERKILEPLEEVNETPSPQPVVQPVARIVPLVYQPPVVSPPLENALANKKDIEKLEQDITVSNNKVITLLGSNLVENTKKIQSLSTLKKVVYGVPIFIATGCIALITILTILFLLYPSQTASLFTSAPIKLPLEISLISTSHAVLGASTITQKNSLAGNPLGTALRPFALISLQVVKQIDQKKYDQIISQIVPKDVTNQMVINENGDIVSIGNLIIPSNATLKIFNKNLVDNLNADFVLSKQPGTENGNLAVFGTDGTIEGLQIGPTNITENAVTTENIVNEAITSAKIADGTIINTNISSNAAITDAKLAQITSGDKVAGSAVQLASGGGLTNNSGISLLTSCSSNQTLVWDGSVWSCGTTSSGTITGLTAGDGLSGG